MELPASDARRCLHKNELEFVADICLRDPALCNGCPVLNREGEHPKCNIGEFYMREENRSKVMADWVVPRPKRAAR